MNFKTLFFLFLLPLNLYSSTIDELIQQFEKVDIDQKVAVFFNLQAELERSYVDSSVYFIQKIESLARSHEREDILAFAHYFNFTYLTSRNLYNEALEKNKLAKEYFIRTENDTMLSQIYNTQANIHLMQGDLSLAEESYLKSIEHGKKSGIPQFEVFSLANLFRVYIHQKRYEEAEEIILYYIDFYKSENNLIKIANGYGLYGKLKMELDDLDEAIKYFEKSLELNLSSGSHLMIANGYTNMAIACFYKGLHERAEQYFKLALSHRQKIDAYYFIIESYQNLADYYSEVEEIDSAIVYINHAIEIAQKTDNKIGMAESYKTLADLYEIQGNYREQAKMLNQCILLTEEIYEEKNSQELATMRMNFQADKEQLLMLQNEREEILKGQVDKINKIWNYWMWMILGIILIVAALIIVKKNKSKTLKE